MNTNLQSLIELDEERGTNVYSCLPPYNEMNVDEILEEIWAMADTYPDELEEMTKNEKITLYITVEPDTRHLVRAVIGRDDEDVVALYGERNVTLPIWSGGPSGNQDKSQIEAGIRNSVETAYGGGCIVVWDSEEIE